MLYKFFYNKIYPCFHKETSLSNINTLGSCLAMGQMPENKKKSYSLTNVFPYIIKVIVAFSKNDYFLYFQNDNMN